MTISPGSSRLNESPGGRTPKKSGARGGTLGPCACSAATRAEVGVKPSPMGSHVRPSAAGRRGGGRGRWAEVVGHLWRHPCWTLPHSPRPPPPALTQALHHGHAALQLLHQAHAAHGLQLHVVGDLAHHEALLLKRGQRGDGGSGQEGGSCRGDHVTASQQVTERQYPHRAHRGDALHASRRERHALHAWPADAQQQRAARHLGMQRLPGQATRQAHKHGGLAVGAAAHAAAHRLSGVPPRQLREGASEGESGGASVAVSQQGMPGDQRSPCFPAARCNPHAPPPLQARRPRVSGGR